MGDWATVLGILRGCSKAEQRNLRASPSTLSLARFPERDTRNREGPVVPSVQLLPLSWGSGNEELEGEVPQDVASARPRHSVGEPLTSRRASSFCGAGRSTEEEGDLTRPEHLAQTRMRPRVPEGASPWRALPRHHLIVPTVGSGSAQGIFIKNIVFTGLSWEEWRTRLCPGEYKMLFSRSAHPVGHEDLPRECLLPPVNLGFKSDPCPPLSVTSAPKAGFGSQ